MSATAQLIGELLELAAEWGPGSGTGEALTDAANALAELTVWRLMNTAAIDGTEILVLRKGGGIDIICWDLVHQNWFVAHNATMHNPPVGWLPLPEAKL